MPLLQNLTRKRTWTASIYYEYRCVEAERDRDERHGIQRTKQAQGARHGELEKVLLKWLKQARAAGVNFDGSVLKEKALKVADVLEIEDFTASNGWISLFRARHGVAYRQLSFQKCGFRHQPSAKDTERSEDDPVARDYDMDEEFLSTGADVPFDEFVVIDDVPTCKLQSVAEIVVEVVADEAPEDDSENEGLRPPATFAEALAGLEALQSFFRTKDNENADKGTATASGNRGACGIAPQSAPPPAPHKFLRHRCNQSDRQKPNE
ncbi:hypothetical protein HPB49_016673 [Dermacentor silvarum]|uniref:Uncharacterized protein n=1 Tax=Dermacentor silvarum TaxID=543639 RepID=A0ACB8E119_DERSI|nr:hypothetical protein HPB49_016673 [Dermacentor silvarum]